MNEGTQRSEVRGGFRVLSWTFAALVVAGMLTLVFILPVILAIVFLVLLVAATGIVVKQEGARKGVIYFVKDILLGW
ncbi:MAG: hypothetical protein QM691_15305 [Opitutaceae bacterium]